MTPASDTAQQRKLITIASGKGGVGKTWLAVTLADALAQNGQRVLLFDGDLGLANVDIQLGLMPEQDVGDVINGTLDLPAAITPFRGGAGRGGFDVLAGKSGSGALGTLSSDRLVSRKQGLVSLASDYDHVILDLAAGVDPSVKILSDHGGTILVVLTADPTSMTDAYAYIKLTSSSEAPTDLRVVVNLADSKRAGEKTYEALRKACQAFLKISPSLAGVVRADKRVADAIRHQAPLLARHPQSVAAAGVLALADGFREPALAG